MKTRLSILAGAWLAACSCGMGLLLVYENTAGASADVPPIWPAESRIPHPKDRSTLLMFAHPDCPCTRASITELATLMTHCQGLVEATVVFYRPDLSKIPWRDTALCRGSKMIPGVAIRADLDGNETKCFRAATSGQVVMYDGNGTLEFDGGITGSRGHEGDNDGELAIEELLFHGLVRAPKTPVFGCSLLNPCQPGKKP